jgi:hypothetical protein
MILYHSSVEELEARLNDSYAKVSRNLGNAKLNKERNYDVKVPVPTVESGVVQAGVRDENVRRCRSKTFDVAYVLSL